MRNGAGMKQTLIIGSTVVDVLLNVPCLPTRGSDVNVLASAFRLGGCAYNVYKAMRYFDVPARLCSPVGTGMYGRMVREWFNQEGIQSFVNLKEENGCCYCLVENDGERSFLSHHGAEYSFSRSWMKDIDHDGADSVFICGIEVEDSTGNEIVEYVCENPQLELYFAPGPRILRITDERMEKIISRSPFLHLNETEAREYAKKIALCSALPDAQDAAVILAEKTRNSVVITLGARGCYYRDKAGGCGFVSGVAAIVRNTVGAGDAHCGALIASLKRGNDLRTSCEKANKAGAHVVSGA
jgi:sugar/nucleoside kinase (ribokinase family)